LATPRHPDFKLPGCDRIDGRSSAITAAFLKAITPVVHPTAAEVDEALQLLGMVRGRCRCAYCGDACTEWDHLRPVVVGRLPSGYITEIANLVPSCGKCNQSKGNSHWRTWMLGPAARSPATRHVPDLALRVDRLAAYERWREPIRVDVAAVVGSDLWTRYTTMLDQAVRYLVESQQLAAELRSLTQAAASGTRSAGATFQA